MQSGWLHHVMPCLKQDSGHYRFPFLDRDLTSDEQSILDRKPEVQVTSQLLDHILMGYAEHPDLPIKSWFCGREGQGPEFRGELQLGWGEEQIGTISAFAATTCHVADRLNLAKIPHALLEFVTTLITTDLSEEDYRAKAVQVVSDCGLSMTPDVFFDQVISAMSETAHRDDQNLAGVVAITPNGPQVLGPFDPDHLENLPDDLPEEVKMALANLVALGPTESGVRMSRVQVTEIGERANPQKRARFTITEISENSFHWQVTLPGSPEPVRKGAESTMGKAEEVASRAAQDILSTHLN